MGGRFRDLEKPRRRSHQSPMTSTPAAGLPLADDRAAIIRGLALVTLAVILLPVQDTIAKYLSSAMSAGQIAFARFFLQTVFTLPFLVYQQGFGGLAPNRLWQNLVRGALISGSSILFFVALAAMPIADALAIFFIEPFILTILSAVVDKEVIGWRRRVAVVVGFIGVLIVVQPSWSVFGPVSLVPAIAGGLFAVYVLLSRRVSAYDTPLAMQFSAGVSALAIIGLALLLGGSAGIPQFSVAAIDGGEAALLLLMGFFGTSGHLFFVRAARLAPPSLIAPMQYVEIVCAALFGYIVFGDFPSLTKWVGIAIIVGSGAYVFWRESRAQ